MYYFVYFRKLKKAGGFPRDISSTIHDMTPAREMKAEHKNIRKCMAKYILEGGSELRTQK